MMKKKLAVLATIPALALVASALTLAPNAFAATAGTPTVVLSGTIHLTKMGLYLDDRNNSSTKGAVVQVWKPTGGVNQVWQVMSDGTIRHNGLCLDVVGAKKTNGAKIDLWTCTGGANQQWRTTGSRITNPVSGKVLNDAGNGGNGTQQVLWTSVGTNNEMWSVVPTPKPVPWGASVVVLGWTYPAPPNCLSEPEPAVIVTGPVNGVFTDVDTYINGVLVDDIGPYYDSLNQNHPWAAGNFYNVPLAPGTYTMTIDIRNGATVLATTAPYKLVVPPAQTGCVQ